MRKLWRIWAKALGEKASTDATDVDVIAGIRKLIVIVNFITCFFIMANMLHNWGLYGILLHGTVSRILYYGNTLYYV